MLKGALKYFDIIFRFIEHKKLGKRKKTILFWNGFWNWPFYGMGEGNSGFISNKCKYTNCYTTNRRSDLFNTEETIDAIIVHGWDKDLSNKVEDVGYRVTVEVQIFN